MELALEVPTHDPRWLCYQCGDLAHLDSRGLCAQCKPERVREFVEVCIAAGRGWFKGEVERKWEVR